MSGRRHVLWLIPVFLRIAPFRRQCGHVRALLRRGPGDRRSLLGVQRVIGMLADGYRSGDLGCLDAQGYPHFLGHAVDSEVVDGVLVTPTTLQDVP
jgi:hypothetical protein